ncbi:MAG: Protein implicated in RNA metabolism containing PRC-barrel domain [Candidatus Methanohalarchaeum thermophilum]|uniref:Protein implicated in RNA metabolism containing PRC-barrel domain n=1 Tax=Methanohalarchaeum thermophilum TaxID=1903181 RepID=A0A1Q6DUE9_METT1|nr:MAG: Protein implicated in RNA metabolism containing PRC-barrel domain [Candidatus Methanohalarchaeum thermophilum]
MESEITKLLNLDVYTQTGRYIGKTEDVMIDIEDKEASKLAVGSLDNVLKEEFNGKKGLLIPYRWVLAVEDIVLIKKLPKKISIEEKETEKETEKEEETEKDSEENEREKEKVKKKDEKEGLFDY